MQQETGRLVLIPHPTEELIFAKLQKELISEFFIDGRIMYAVKPLWIEIETSERWLGWPEAVSKPQLEYISVTLANLETTAREIFIPVTIKMQDTEFRSKLTLVNIYNGKDFSDSEHEAISKKNQPVRQLKIFRLGIEKELSSNSKCISESKWFKLK